jgi:hypothetical protein
VFDTAGTVTVGAELTTASAGTGDGDVAARDGRGRGRSAPVVPVWVALREWRLLWLVRNLLPTSSVLGRTCALLGRVGWCTCNVDVHVSVKQLVRTC